MGKLKPWARPTKKAALTERLQKGFPPFNPVP